MLDGVSETIKHLVQLSGISLVAASVQMYISKQKFTFFHYLMAVLMALLSAYIADAICAGVGMDGDIKTGVIGIAAYSAPHLLDGIDNFAERFAKEPLKVIAEVLRIRKGS